MADGTLNLDLERRSYWSATMPALPDRSGRQLPDTADVVIVGGGFAGIDAARELARRGTEVTLLEARTLAGGDVPALARLSFPLVPAPCEGRPWFMPLAGEWFRLQDRLAARGSAR